MMPVLMPVLASAGRMRAWTTSVCLAFATLAATIAIGYDADARSGRRESAIEAVQTREPGEPILAVVSLREQKITVYDAKGWILRAPVSSGQKGRETPAGIFAVIQKDAEHYSNLYDDAYMPNMQRITWSGVALHGGALPGYPASHGCIRLPFDFAASLFEVTDLGLRVIVAPAEAAPTEISHPALFPPKPADTAQVAARNAEAAEATRKATEVRRAAVAAFREHIQAMTAVRVTDYKKQKVDTQLTAAEAALAAATSPEAKQQAEEAKTAAASTIADLQTQLTAARAELQTKADAAAAARAAADTADAARNAADEAVRQAARQLAPVSVLISRKTQKLYVRQSFEPVFESPVTITDPDRPIGTHVFTAMERGGSDASLRWSAITLEGADEPKAALDRISIPQDVLDRIPGASPRSSLIVSDEPPSAETGKGTDFVVILSDQPQGGIKFRRRSSSPEMSYFGPSGRQRDFMTYWGPQFGRGFR